MSQPTEAVLTCPQCGADSVPFAKHCWMCGADLQNAPKRNIPIAGQAKPTWAAGESTALIVVAILCAVVLLVGLGIAANEPGLVIPYAIFAGPALLATLIRATRKRVQGKPMGIAESIGTFLVSGMIVFGILVLLVIALIIGLIAYCFAELARH